MLLSESYSHSFQGPKEYTCDEHTGLAVELRGFGRFEIDSLAVSIVAEGCKTFRLWVSTASIVSSCQLRSPSVNPSAAREILAQPLCSRGLANTTRAARSISVRGKQPSIEHHTAEVQSNPAPSLHKVVEHIIECTEQSELRRGR